MLFYVILLFACIGAATIVVWCYRAVSHGVESVHEAIHPVWEEAYDKHLIKGVVQPLANRATAARTRPSSNVVAQLHQARNSSALQSLSYSKPSITEVQNQREEFTVREPAPEPVGNAYRVKRQVQASRSGAGKVSKPWGW